MAFINGLKIGNILLVINTDSTAVYRKCKVKITKCEGLSKNVSASASFSVAVIIQFSELSIALAQQLG